MIATVLNLKVSHIIIFISIKLEINERYLKGNIIQLNFSQITIRLKRIISVPITAYFWKEMKTVYIKRYHYSQKNNERKLLSCWLCIWSMEHRKLFECLFSQFSQGWCITSSILDALKRSLFIACWGSLGY